MWLAVYVGVETAPSEPLTLDVVGPSVSGVEIISTPISGDVYRVFFNEVIRVAVGFDEAVEVSTPTAGPRLTLTIWKTTRAATYMPDLSEASTLVFAYVLQAGDVDVDGISIEEGRAGAWWCRDNRRFGAQEPDRGYQSGGIMPSWMPVVIGSRNSGCPCRWVWSRQAWRRVRSRRRP